MPAQTMTRVDSAWLHMDQPANPMVVTALLDFDERLDVARLRATLQERLVDRLPRFGMRVADRGVGRPRWVTDDAFDIDDHLHHVALPAGAGESALRDYVAAQMSQQLRAGRPLWELTVIDRPDGGSSLLARIHHSIADGIALVGVLVSLTDLDAAGEMRIPLEPPALKPRESVLRRVAVAATCFATMASAAREIAGKGQALVRVALMSADTAGALKRPLTGSKRCAWSQPIDLASLKSLKSIGCSVNDVVVAAAAGAVRRWMLESGVDPSSITMRATVPMNLRPLEEALALGNEFGILYLDLPVGVADPRARLAAAKEAMDRLKQSSEAGAAKSTLGLLGSLPRAAQRRAVSYFAGKASSVLTNVPGPALPLHLAGSRIRDVMFWVPQTGGVGLGLSILSYDGHIRLGVATDRAVAAHPERITHHFSEEIATLTGLAAGSRSHPEPTL